MRRIKDATSQSTVAFSFLKDRMNMKSINYSLFHLRGDLFGGLTAGVVALPLALAFGVASGAGAIAGLYGAIALGFFAALLGGTPSQVSGPTGPMTVITAAAVAGFPGDLQAVFTVVLIAGALQIVFGAIKAGDSCAIFRIR